MSTTIDNSDSGSNQQMQEQTAEHSYGDLQLFSNPVPRWWSILLVLFVIFAPLYLFYFHLGVEERSIHEQYNTQLASLFEQKFEEIGILTADEATILEYMDKPKWLAVGKVMYQTNCVSCHGAKGEGLVGPNLTDNFWKHASSVEGVARVIENGAGNGNMPAWQDRMSHPNQIVLTAAYVASMRENPVAGKAPEGKEVPPWN